MLKAYSNNGQSWRYIEPDWALTEGEVLFDHEPTDGELDSAFPGRQATMLVEARNRALAAIRAQRSPMLDTLSGIAGRATRRGDVATTEAADAAYDALLDITATPAFLAAETYDDMKAAIMNRYREIAESAPEVVQKVFVEVLG